MKTEAIIIGDIHERFAIKKDENSKGDSDIWDEEKKIKIINLWRIIYQMFNKIYASEIKTKCILRNIYESYDFYKKIIKTLVKE